MADFTGTTVRVVMKAPNNMVVQGVVKEVVPGRVLILKNVHFLHNGSHCMEYSIRNDSIADLQVLDMNALPSLSSAAATPAASLPTPNARLFESRSQSKLDLPSAVEQVDASAPHQPKSFVDPAILSYARSPGPQRSSTNLSATPATPVRSMLAQAAESLPVNASPFIGDAKRASNGVNKDTRAEAPIPQFRPAIIPHTKVHDQDDVRGQAQAGIGTKKKTRRSQKKKPATDTQEPPTIMDAEVSRNGNSMDTSVKRGKGWRQTPLLQPSPHADSPSNNRERRSRKVRESQQNGWATEDATDIQDMGDFDFEASLKLFDKQSVFSALRQGDTTADEDRLVSHNKLPPRPGTYGGKNLHPTENVLSPKLTPHDSSSDADTELNHPSGNDLGLGARSTSLHSLNRIAMKKAPSRQNSSQIPPHPLSASVSSDRSGLPRTSASITAKGTTRTATSTVASPMPSRVKSPISPTTPAAPLYPILQPHFAIKSTRAPCPVLLPSALETLEAETIARYGLLPEAIAESAARSIAETALDMFKIDSRRGSRTNTMSNVQHAQPNADPVVVIIAGNHPTGARALAAVRHLLTRKTSVIIAETTSEPHEHDSQYRVQLSVLKRLVKSGANIKRGTWRRAWNYIKNLSGPPAIIIDALLAGSTYDSLLDSSELDPSASAAQLQGETREMIDWANRSRAPVLSIACPSGVSGFDGSATILEGEPLAIRPNRVIGLGAPMKGLLDAAKSGESWDLIMADIGINVALRRDEAVAFANEWVVELEFIDVNVSR